MALSNNLLSFTQPYVHSNLSNLSGSLRGSLLDISSEEGKRRIQQQIDELEKVGRILKDEADAFLDGESCSKVFQQLNKNQYELAKIGLEILNDPQTIKIVSGQTSAYTGKDLIKAFPNLSESFTKVVKDQTAIGINEAIDLVAKDIIDSLTAASGKGSVNQQFDIITKKLSLSSKAAEKRVAELVKGKLSSEKGKIRQVIETELKKKTRRTNLEKKQFVAYFKKRFLFLTSSKLQFVQQEEIDEYLTEVERKILNLDDSIFTGEKSSMIGKLGEDFFKIVTLSGNSFNCQIDLTSLLKEEEIIQQFPNKIAGILKTHHSMDKESQTDMLITNKKNNKTVRVQAKNLQSAYQSLITERPFPGFAQLQNTEKYIGLINALQSSESMHLTEEDLGQLSYLLANELWFRTHESIDFGDKTRGISSTGSTINYISQIVEQLLTKELVNFMGINIDESIDVTASAASRSNAFYLIANKALVPSYLIIQDIIKNLKREQANYAKISVSIELQNHHLGTANAFYRKKKEAVDKLDAKLNYSDPQLVKVGQEMGEKIIQNLNIRKIGLKFNMKEIMNSSWVF